ncbi:MAG TPA: GGDEF domain-containing protein [Treponemataceae bacterium]|nr:GGDEF domain-containing protein [Treponemataceae bacterium]
MSDSDQKRAIISSSRVFSRIPQSCLDDIAANSTLRTCKASETLFNATDESPDMFFIVSGEFSVLRQSDTEGLIEIARLVAGDSLGEIDMISGRPRTVTVKAGTDAAVVSFPRAGVSFRDYIEKSPATGSRILYSLIGFIADRTRKADAALKENAPYIQELRKQIYEDKLTGLRNKTWLEDNLASFIVPNRPLALIMLKPDNFKQVCDHDGHEAGSSLLARLASGLPAILPEGAPLIRYAGNEFAIILPSFGREAALAVAEGIREYYGSIDIADLTRIPGFKLTVSEGIALYPDHASDSGGLISRAHPLPLAGRAKGGNKILFADANSEAQP